MTRSGSGGLPPRRQFAAGAFGQASGLVATLGVQVAQIPVMVGAVGVEAYGQYLLVVAAPTLLTMSDLGLLAAFSTSMLQANASGDLVRARSLSRLASAALLGLGFLVFVILIAAAGWLSSTPIAALGWSIPVFVGYGIYALLNLQTNAYEGILRAGGLQGMAWTLVAGVRVVEFAVAALALVVTRNLAIFVLALVIARALAIAILARITKRRAPWADRRPSLDGWRDNLYLVKPMLGSLSQPVVGYIYVQGAVVFVGTTMGPHAVATLSVLRTSSSLIRQLSQVFVFASMPMLTRSFAVGETAAVRKTYRSMISVVAPLVILSGSSLILIGPWLINLWTAGSISVDRGLIALFVLVAVCDVSLSVVTLRLIARNQHFGYALLAILFASVFIAACLLFVSTIAGVAVVQMVTVAFTALAAVFLTRRANRSE